VIARTVFGAATPTIADGHAEQRGTRERAGRRLGV